MVEKWLPSDEEFKCHLRLNRQKFELVLNVVTPFTVKQPTNMKPTPTPLEIFLACRLYHLAHGYLLTIGALLGVSESLASITFNKVVRVLVVTMYDYYVKLPLSSDEWETQFIETMSLPVLVHGTDSIIT